MLSNSIYVVLYSSLPYQNEVFQETKCKLEVIALKYIHHGLPLAQKYVSCNTTERDTLLNLHLKGPTTCTKNCQFMFFLSPDMLFLTDGKYWPMNFVTLVYLNHTVMYYGITIATFDSYVFVFFLLRQHFI